eukprot:jgi/Mesvir1/29209/Mv08627-RA.1
MTAGATVEPAIGLPVRSVDLDQEGPTKHTKKKDARAEAHIVVDSTEPLLESQKSLGATADANALVIEYLSEGIIDAIRARAGWLLFFFCGLVVSAVIIQGFEDVIADDVELSDFMPLLLGHGGNAGSQTVSSVIRALALGEVSHADMPYVLWKEATTGCVVGAALGLGLFAVSLVCNALHPRVGLTVAVALPLVSLWANLLGGLLPFLAVKFGQDPATTSMPFMSTLVDSSGLLIYLFVAKMIAFLAS